MFGLVLLDLDATLADHHGVHGTLSRASDWGRWRPDQAEMTRIDPETDADGAARIRLGPCRMTMGWEYPRAMLPPDHPIDRIMELPKVFQ